MAEAPILSNPPDWNTCTLDLYCPRCEYNLCMLTGSRCPECGLDLDWPRIVAAGEKRVDSPLFEYRWRSQPVRSFFATIWLCLRPWRLWKSLSIADAPRSAGLAVFGLVTFLSYAAILISSSVVWVLLLRMMQGRRPPSLVFWLLSFTSSTIVWSIADFCVLVGIAFLMWLFLQIFQQTISKYRINRVQLARVVVFAYVPLLFVKLFSQIILKCLYIVGFRSGFDRATCDVITDYLALGVCFFSLGLGLGTYLKVLRGWGIAGCLLILTFLACLTLVISISVRTGLWANPIAEAIDSTWPGLAYSITRLLAL